MDRFRREQKTREAVYVKPSAPYVPPSPSPAPSAPSVSAQVSNAPYIPPPPPAPSTSSGRQITSPEGKFLQNNITTGEYIGKAMLANFLIQRGVKWGYAHYNSGHIRDRADAKSLSGFMYEQIKTDKDGTLHLLQYYPQDGAFAELVDSKRFKARTKQDVRETIGRVVGGVVSTALSVAATTYGSVTLSSLNTDNVRKPSFSELAKERLEHPEFFVSAVGLGLAASAADSSIPWAFLLTGGTAFEYQKEILSNLNFILEGASNAMTWISSYTGRLPDLWNYITASLQINNMIVGMRLANAVYVGMRSGDLRDTLDQLDIYCGGAIKAIIRLVFPALEAIASETLSLGNKIGYLMARLLTAALIAAVGFLNFNTTGSVTDTGLFVDGVLFAMDTMEEEKSLAPGTSPSWRGRIKKFGRAFGKGVFNQVNAVFSRLAATFTGINPVEWFDALTKEIPKLFELATGGGVVSLLGNFVFGILFGFAVKTIEQKLQPGVAKGLPETPISVTQEVRQMLAGTCALTEMLAGSMVQNYSGLDKPFPYVMHMLDLSTDWVAGSCANESLSSPRGRGQERVNTRQLVLSILKGDTSTAVGGLPIWLANPTTNLSSTQGLHAAKLVLISLAIPQLVLLTTSIAVLEDLRRIIRKPFDQGGTQIPPYDTVRPPNVMSAFMTAALTISVSAMVALSSTLQTLGVLLDGIYKAEIRTRWESVAMTDALFLIIGKLGRKSEIAEMWRLNQWRQRNSNPMDANDKRSADVLFVALVHARSVMAMQRLGNFMTVISNVSTIFAEPKNRALCSLVKDTLVHVRQQSVPNWLMSYSIAVIPLGGASGLRASIGTAPAKKTDLEKYITTVNAKTRLVNTKMNAYTKAVKSFQSAISKKAALKKPSLLDLSNAENRIVTATADVTTSANSVKALFKELEGMRKLVPAAEITKLLPLPNIDQVVELLPPPSSLTNPDITTTATTTTTTTAATEPQPTTPVVRLEEGKILKHILQTFRILHGTEKRKASFLHCLNGMMEQMESTQSSDIAEISHTNKLENRMYCHLLEVPARLDKRNLGGVLFSAGNQYEDRPEGLFDSTIRLLDDFPATSTGWTYSGANKLTDEQMQAIRTDNQPVSPEFRRNDVSTVMDLALNCMELLQPATQSKFKEYVVDDIPEVDHGGA